MAQERFEVILQRDPLAANLDVTDAQVSTKTRKELKRAVSALKSHLLPEAENHLNRAYQSSPNSSNINFLLGYLFFEKRDYAQAERYLSSASTLNPHDAQALTLLGRTGMERQNYPAARSALEQAILADPENWLPHNLLADTYLHEKNYESAKVEANQAVTKGQAAASPAQLVLGQALLNLGQFQDELRPSSYSSISHRTIRLPGRFAISSRGSRICPPPPSLRRLIPTRRPSSQA